MVPCRRIITVVARPLIHPTATKIEADIDDTTVPSGLDDDEATELTPLVHSNTPTKQSIQRIVLRHLSPVSIATIFGLLIGVIKPIQRLVVGDVTDQRWTSGWQSLGTGITLLGASFALIEIFSKGAGIRAGEKRYAVWFPSCGMVLTSHC
jgi:hypothetical protein